MAFHGDDDDDDEEELEWFILVQEESPARSPHYTASAFPRLQNSPFIIIIITTISIMPMMMITMIVLLMMITYDIFLSQRKGFGANRVPSKKVTVTAFMS